MSFDIDVLILYGIMESAVNELTGIITGIADGNNSKEPEGVELHDLQGFFST